MSSPNADKKTASSTQTQTEEHINLKVVDSENNEVYFKIKRKTALKRLMTAYCEKQGKSQSSCRFIYDGERIEGHQTPDGLDMEDNDTIEVAVEQIGGFF